VSKIEHVVMKLEHFWFCHSQFCFGWFFGFVFTVFFIWFYSG